MSGINHGTNLGDDITYSGTVAAALEGMVLGMPAIAVSQQSLGGEMDFRAGLRFDFDEAATFVARLVEELEDVPVPEGTLLNVNAPGGDARGARVCRLGKRIYRDKMDLVEKGDDGRRRYRIYGERPGHHEEEGTDFDGARRGPDRRHAAALRPHRRGRDRGAVRIRPRRADPARRPRG